MSRLRGSVILSLRGLAVLSMVSSLGCGFGAWLAGMLDVPDEVEFVARGNELECFVDIRPQGMPGISSTTLSSRGPEMLSANGAPLRRYRVSRDCMAGYSFPTLEAAESDWRLFYSLRVNELVEEGDPLFAMEGGEWCEVPGTLRCVEREEIDVCRSMGEPFEVTPETLLAACEPPPDPFSVTCDGDACTEVAFGETAIGSASPLRPVVTIENAGGEGGVELRIAYDGAVSPVDGIDGLAEFRVEENGCVGQDGSEIEVAPGDSCSFVVVFQPSRSGVHQGAIPLTYSYPSDQGMIQGAFTLPVSGIASEPLGSCIDVTCVDGTSCTAIDFGVVELGQTSGIERVTVSNCGADGSPDIELATPVIDPAAAEFGVSEGSCGATLAASSSCEYEVVFEPTSGGGGVGPRSATLEIGYGFTGEAATAPYSIGLDGEAEEPPPVPGCLSVACIDGSACDRIDFGLVDVGQSSSPVAVSVSNCGATGAPDVIVTYDGATAPLGSGFAVGLGSCFADGSESLAVGGPACEVEIDFAPTFDGAVAATTTFDYQYAGSAVQRFETVDLEGIGDGRILRVTPPAGACLQDVLASGCTEPVTFELRNLGTVPLTVDCVGMNLATTGAQCPGYVLDGGFEIVSPTGFDPPGTLNPGGAESVRVRWCGAAGDEATAMLGVLSDDPTEPQIERQVDRKVDCSVP